MATGMDKSKKSFFRTTSCILWTATFLVTAYMVWCALVLILTTSGVLLKSQSFDCWNSTEFLPVLKSKFHLVYWCSGLNLLACVLLLHEMWRKGGFYYLVILGTGGILVYTFVSIYNLQGEMTQETQKFKEHCLALLPFTETQGKAEKLLKDTHCGLLTSVYHWQTEFKCCGLDGYQDWKSFIPDSCLCDNEDDSVSCLGAGNSLVYEKACLPIVLPLVEECSDTFWIVLKAWLGIIGTAFIPLFLVGALFWLTIIGAAFILLLSGGGYICTGLYAMSNAIFNECLSCWKCQRNEGRDMVPVDC